MKNKFIYVAFVILLSLSLYFYFTKNNSTIKGEYSDFAVEDTASITKIFMADKANNQVLLERSDNSKWLVNGKVN